MSNIPNYLRNGDVIPRREKVAMMIMKYFMTEERQKRMLTGPNVLEIRAMLKSCRLVADEWIKVFPDQPLHFNGSELATIDGMITEIASVLVNQTTETPELLRSILSRLQELKKAAGTTVDT